MKISLRRAVVPAAISVLAGLGVCAPAAPRAEACGAFFRPQSAERAPSLSLERVLILFDEKSKKEHFIREIVFKGGKETFGFVVPTPSWPEVHKVKKAPFTELERFFPFEPPAQMPNASRGAPGGGSKGAAPPVTVLEVKKLGSFTAFVLKATDAKALGGWLEENKLGTTPENDAWLAEYVKRDFFYVAFRYEPTESKGDALQAETVRISFDTPVAYYPYREPAHPAGKERSERAVAMWVVSPSPVAPVALTKEGDRDIWVRPFAEGMRAPTTGSGLQSILSDEEDALVDRDASYVVQPFEDQKSQRPNYGDAVFLPEGGVPAADRAALKPLLEKLLVPPSGGK